MADSIAYDLTDGLAQITLDDGKVNAMTLEFFGTLNAALDRAERDKPGAAPAGRAPSPRG
jgi:enoyl-CoA hydratase